MNELEAISWDLQLEFKLEDLWVGAFWRQTPLKFDLWVCLLPCLPIHLTIEKHLKNKEIKEYTALDFICRGQGGRGPYCDDCAKDMG